MAHGTVTQAMVSRRHEELLTLGADNTFHHAKYVSRCSADGTVPEEKVVRAYRARADALSKEYQKLRDENGTDSES